MNKNDQFTQFRTKATLSTLWLFVLLNIIFRDMHEFYRHGFFEEWMGKIADGTLISAELMLVAGMTLELFIAMVILSRLLPYRINRWANIVIAIFMGVSMAIAAPNDLDDVWFLAMELIGLGTIVWMAWRWQAPDEVAHPVSYG